MITRWLDIRRVTSWLAIELGTLVSVLIVAGGVLVFVELIEMTEGEPHAFDRLVLLAFRNPVDRADPIVPNGSSSCSAILLAWAELRF